MGELMKKILIAFYSRTGTTRKIAIQLKQNLNCDMEEIIDMKSRKGFWGNLGGGIDSLFGRKTMIKSLEYPPGEYDLVILGSPVWFGNPPPALGTYVRNNKDSFPQLACFCTFAGKGDVKTSKKIMAFSGKKMKRLSVKNSDTDSEILSKLKSFIKLCH
jgi:flavodoxin